MARVRLSESKGVLRRERKSFLNRLYDLILAVEPFPFPVTGTLQQMLTVEMLAETREVNASAHFHVSDYPLLAARCKAQKPSCKEIKSEAAFVGGTMHEYKKAVTGFQRIYYNLEHELNLLTTLGEFRQAVDKVGELFKDEEALRTGVEDLIDQFGTVRTEEAMAA